MSIPPTNQSTRRTGLRQPRPGLTYQKELSFDKWVLATCEN